MSPLERDVIDILWKHLGNAKCPDGFAEPNNYERAVHLASYVAAAIEEAAYDSIGGYYDGALRALKGEA